MADDPSSQTDNGLFRLAAPAVARHPDVILTPRELQRWMDTLPLANPARAASTLLQQLRLLVRDPRPGGKLAALLAVYASTVDRLMDFVNDRLQGTPELAMPLDQLEHALLDILNDMAEGYLRVANDTISVGKTPAAETLFRAMLLLDDAQHLRWMHYLRPSAANWQQQVQIFRHADFHQISNERVGSARGVKSPRTIRQLFFRSLIVNLTDPSHHLPGEIAAWREWLGDRVDGVSLSLLPEGPFALPVDIVGERLPLDSARRAKPGPNTRYLSADDLLKQLVNEEGAPKALYQALNQLIRGRKAAEQRQSVRQPSNQPYLLLHGLGNIHQRLTDLTQGGKAPATTIGTNDCRLVNQSKLGAALRLDSPPVPPLAVGEPVLLESAATHRGPPVGFAGRIQRLVSDTDQTIEIGVEKLQGRLVPVTAVGPAAERSRGNRLALLQNGPDPDSYTLLASSHLYREGDTISVESLNARYTLRMRGLRGAVAQIAIIDVEKLDNPLQDY